MKRLIILVAAVALAMPALSAQSTTERVIGTIVDALFGGGDTPTHKYIDAGSQAAFTVPKDVLEQASSTWYDWSPVDSKKVKVVSSSRTSATVKGLRSTSSTIINYRYKTKIVGKDGRETEEIMSYPYTLTIYRVEPTGLTIDQESAVGWGVSKTLSPVFTPKYAEAALSFDSTDPSVVTVSSDGKMSGKQLGEADIVIRSENGLETSTHVTVVIPQVSDISLVGFNKKTKFYVGDVYQYGYSHSPAHAEPQVTWYSTDTDVATVEQDGTVTFIGTGKVTVYCKDRTGNYDRFTVKVRNR